MNSATKHPPTRAKSKSVIVSHLKTLVTYGISSLTHSKTKNHIVQTKNHIVQTKNHIVQTKNHIVQTKNHIVIFINCCFYLKNIILKNLKNLKNFKEPSFY